MIMTYERSAGAVVFTRVNGELRYAIIKSNEGICGFPKGHLEAGEDEETAARREILEEVGIRAELVRGFLVTTQHPLPKKPGVIKHITYFVATYSDQILTHQPSELDSVMLMKYEDALSAIQFDDTRGVLKQAHEFINKLK